MFSTRPHRVQTSGPSCEVLRGAHSASGRSRRSAIACSRASPTTRSAGSEPPHPRRGMHRAALEFTLDVTQTEISRASVGLRSERGPILLAVMLSVGLVAIDSTILATAVPSVVDDLGGFSQFPWLFSIYLLGQAVSVPIS